MTTKLTTKLVIRLGPGVDRPEFLEAVDTATDSAAVVLVDRDATGGAVDLETDDPMTSIASVLDVATAHGVPVLSVDELVTASEIAGRAGVTRGAVTNFVSGARGPGGFPAPINPGARNEVYRWAEVNAWLNRSAEAQAEAAAKCGVTQPRMNDLLRGRVSRFSLDALVDIATALGRRVRVEIGAD